ncbi:MAG: glycosyl hydrolase family 18 protein [Hyphomicrobiales bacterium]
MSRRGGQLPWGNRRSPTLYGSRQPSVGQPLALGLIVVGVLALAVFLFMRACGGGGCNDTYCSSDKDIQPPEGYERVTGIYEYNESKGPIPEGNTLNVTLSLTRDVQDSRNLSFYRYVEESQVWEPVAPATLEADGKNVTGTLNDAPKIMTVLRRTSPAGHVVAYLPHNGQLHPEAKGKITILHTRDYQPAADGTVTGSISTLQPEQGVAWYPTISSDASMLPIVDGILSSAPSRSNHVAQIVKLATDAGFAGIDIAYMDLRPDERTNFTLFIAELASALHAKQKVLTLTLPPPQKVQDRIDEGAYDWAQLGKAADVVQMAPYRDQGKYRQVMPDLLQYLVGVVDPSKLVLTVSPYATEASSDGIRTMQLTDAMVIATKLQLRVGADSKVETNTNVDVVGVNIDRSENLTGISWSPEAASVFFTYKQGSGRTVYLENFFSIGFKLELIPQFKLGGVAIEDASANRFLGDIWTALNPFITSGQPILMQPNPEDLKPQWSVSKGETDRGDRGILTWTTPSEPGRYTVTLTLSDGVARFQNAIPVEVQAKETAGATPSAGG